jgi:hypothetical protein
MRSTTEAFAIATMCLVAGTLMILLRNRFARSTVESLLDIKPNLQIEKAAEEGLRRFCSIGMAAFGATVIIIGVAIAGGVL